MGMPVGDLKYIDRIHKMIAKAEVEFDLVMISEKSEESLILLASRLCWPLNYVTGFNHFNVRRDMAKYRKVSQIYFSYILTCGEMIVGHY